MQMHDPNPKLPPDSGQYMPPQPTHVSPDGKWFWDGTKWAPTHAVSADIPPQSPYHYSPAPSRRASGGIGAGLLAGTIGATAAFFLYLSTQWEVFLLAALIGFYINLFNMIPVWQLDGAWVLAPVSKWFQLAGYLLIAVGVIVFGFVSPLIIIIALLGIPTLVQRFRDSSNPYYTSVPMRGRIAMGAAWLALVIYLGVMSLQADTLLGPLVR